MALITWLLERLFGIFGRRREFDRLVIDHTLRKLNATTSGFVAILNSKRPKDPFAAGDMTYADTGSIGDDAAMS
ncbi:MAG: hypothetical protein ACT4PI_14175 [Actinomycetota bacterium]